MSGDFVNDVFLSFSHKNVEQAKLLHDLLQDHGLRVYWAEERLKKEAAGGSFTPQLMESLTESQHFILCATTEIQSSRWVETEWSAFHDQCHMVDADNRRMYVLLDEGQPEKCVPTALKSFQRLSSNAEVTAAVMREQLSHVKGHRRGLEQGLRAVEQKLKQAFQYYRHSRFWRPVLENRDLHIYTCARDMPYDSTMARGRGGRTNIDKWDFQTVLDVTRFFASKYPDVKLTIEDPISKLSGEQFGARGSHYQFARMMQKLQNQDCIIVGSPDVSDFAEIALAEVHRIKPYTSKREKSKGFIHIKDAQKSPSCGYWVRKKDESEGVARIEGRNNYRIYKAEITKDRGTAFGVLAVVRNPFCDEGVRRTIIMFSGFSGIATNAIARFLTNEKYIKEFYKLDQAYDDSDTDWEALIGARFSFDGEIDARDARVFDDADDAVFFCELVKI